MGNRTLSVVLSVCVLLLCGSSFFLGQTVAPQTFTLEQVMSSPFPTNLVASEPSKEHCRKDRLGICVQGARANVWIADLPNFEARQVTHYTGDVGMPIAALKLTPTERLSSTRVAAK